MAAKLSYEEVRRLARIWFAEAREKSVQDGAEAVAWTKGQRKWNSCPGGGGDGGRSGDRGGDRGNGD